jgi:hypothetical protein
MNAAHSAHHSARQAVTNWVAFLEERRPGIKVIADRVAHDHPEWTEEACAAHAKVLWSCPTIATRENGRWVERRNPDYMGARVREQREGGDA